MRFHITLLLLLLAVPGISHALGLGKIETRSGLNEPFDARIELIGATADDLVGLNVRLADAQAFEKAGIERAFILSQLTFGIRETEKGPDYIRIYTQDPIQEPFLNFLVEITWPQGRLIREYTVLLDPPVYAPTTGIVSKQVESPVESISPITTEKETDHSVVYYPEYEQKSPESMTVPARPVDYTGGDYGPTVTGDTLWSIAKAMRPDSSVSIQQMMLALLRANPDAFINGNINGLKRGEVLRLPDISDVQSLSKSEAFGQAKTQNELWESARMAMAASPAQRPEGLESSVGETVPTEEEETPAGLMVEETEPELRLVAPTDEGIGTEQPVSEGEVTGEAAAKELALVKESLETLKLENAELEEKLVESEEIIGDLKRLIALKEDEFNALEEQIKQTAAEEEARLEQAQATMEQEGQEAVMQEETVMEETQETPETMQEEPAPETTEMAEEKTAPEVVQAEVSQPVAEGGIMATVMGYLNGFLNLVKGNLMLLAGGLAAVIVLIGIGMFALKRRGTGETNEMQEVKLPVFDELGDEDSEDITDLPGFEEETAIAPEQVKEQEVATQIAAPATPTETPAVEDEEPEEDPLADVNVFLAYEQFDQAEEFVRNALEGDPDNPEFLTKLLEVFYAAGNKKSYEEAARVLHPIVNGQGEYWDMALAMWQELSPNRAMFEEPAEGEEDIETAAEPGGGVVNITEDMAGEPREAVLDVTAAIDLDEGIEEGTEEEAGSAPDFDLSMDIDSEAETLSEEPSDESEMEFTEAEDNEVLDVSAALDFDLEEEEAIEEPAADESEVDENILDISSEEGLSMEPPDEEEMKDADVLDITGGSEAELELSDDMDVEEEDEKDTDMLDITGGYETSLEEEQEDVVSEAEENEILDVTGGQVSDLDISFDDEGSSEEHTGQEAEDILDLSLDEEPPVSDEVQPLDEDSGLEFSMEETPDEESVDEAATDLEESYSDAKAEDLLDVTSAMDYQKEEPGTSNLLDVTTAFEGEEEQKDTEAEIEMGIEELPETEENPPDEDEIALDISLEQETEEAADDSVASLDLDITGTADKSDEEIEASMDLEADIEEARQEEEAGGLDFDISMDKGEEEPVSEEAPEEKEPSFELDMSSNLIDLSIEDESKEAENDEYEMDQTVHIPGIGLSMDDEDEEQPTVFVPRSDGTEQKSEEDEIGTQLDLARAYIELGDNDNAKTILDEIISNGTDQQRQDAQELLGKIT